jgi:hypothetical protein
MMLTPAPSTCLQAEASTEAMVNVWSENVLGHGAESRGEQRRESTEYGSKTKPQPDVLWKSP